MTSYATTLAKKPQTILTDLSKQGVRVVGQDGHELTLTEKGLLRYVKNYTFGIPHVSAKRIVEKSFNGIHEGTEWVDIHRWLTQTTAMLISEEPEYSKAAARFLIQEIYEELKSVNILSFSQSVAYGKRVGLIADHVAEFVQQHQHDFNKSIEFNRHDLFEYFGLRTVYDRYLLRDPQSRKVIECPQYFFLRVSCGLSESFDEAVQFYHLISSFQYMPSTPTLFNSGTKHAQMSSCYLLDSPEDSLEAIYGKYTDVALLSKFAGGIGVSFSRVRSRGSLIQGTNGKSNGIVPFLKTLDSSVSAVNQGGKRKGAACVYLETWHADVLEFLQLRDNTGDEALRTHNLNLAHWIPDLFMERVERDEWWSLFDPKDVPHFVDRYGDEFNQAYLKAEEQKLFRKQIKARELYAQMMKTLAQTGNGWMTFKDASNRKGNQTYLKENVIHLSNLCTEILEVTNEQETAVCNLGSINLSRYVKTQGVQKTERYFDFDLLAKNVQIAVKYLDRVIDINFYPIQSAENSNHKWRPVGLGVMGLQNVFFQLGLPFDDPRAKELSTRIQEEIYYNALKASSDLAEQYGPHTAYHETRASIGQLQFDLWGVQPKEKARWDALKERMDKTGLRNSLLIAIAPTATIASITGAYECIEPQISNLFKRETLSGEFLQINPYLVEDLRQMGMWNEEIKQKIKWGEGSIQHLEELPEETRLLYRTVWEIPQRALIDMAGERGAYIDQSQSLNLFIENPNLGKISSLYMHVWKKGLKTSYYFRSRGATRINKATVSITSIEEKAMACSLENPEMCESCM